MPSSVVVLPFSVALCAAAAPKPHSADRMEIELTTGVVRLFREAESLAQRDGVRTQLPHLSMALAAEEECLARAWLEDAGISADLLAASPDLSDSTDSVPGEPSLLTPRPTSEFSRISLLTDEGPCVLRAWDAQVEMMLNALARLLQNYPPPCVLGTEHLLLGLAESEHEIGRRLRDHGLDPKAIRRRIEQRYGLEIDTSPLPFDETESVVSESALPEVPEPNSTQGSVDEDAAPLDAPSFEFLQETPPAATLGQQTAEGAIEHDEQADEETPPEAEIDATPIPPTAPEGSDDATVLASLLRIVDAAGNRAREGLRVVEDYVRFVLDDVHLTGLLKNMRHELSAVLSEVSWRERLASRETQRDVGTAVSTHREYRRESLENVLAANFLRFQEALRSLEEFTKVTRPDLAARIEALRYQSYTLHRAVGTTTGSMHRLGDARLYVLIDGRENEADFADDVRQLVDAGVGLIQLRDKHLDDRTLLQRARKLRDLTAASNTLFIMNDRPDLAKLARADGVHVGQEELSVHDVRAIVGAASLIGVSTHSVEQARQAVLDGADYIGVGPTFPSETKDFNAFPGLDLVRAVAGEIRLPAYAIGGIATASAQQVLETGIHGLAISAAISNARYPGDAARQFSELIASHGAAR